MNDGEVEKSPAATLDQVRDGGTSMLGIIRHRIVELEQFLDEGDFDSAHDRAGEIAAKLGILAWAQMNLASLVRQHIVRARDLEEGMVIGRFTVASVEVETHQCVGGTDHTTVKVQWEGEDGDANFDGNQELMVTIPG